MEHLVNNKDEVYRILAERLNINPMGASINDTLMAICIVFILSPKPL